MRFLLMIILLGLSELLNAQSIKLDVVKSIEASPGDYTYAENLSQLIEGEMWGFNSGPIGIPTASSSLRAQDNNTYKVENIHDLDLTTAWVEGSTGFGVGEYFTFEFDWKEEFEGFGKVYNFYGVIEIFNGYCKSEQLWNENSRVKLMKIYFNEQPICFIELVDTWQYQRVDLRKYFNDPQDGDIIKFEIIEVYKGSKYTDTAISEFVFESPSN